MLNVLYQVPDALLDCEAHQLHEKLGGPTLLHLEGDTDRSVFISVLLHGNEVSGWYVVRQLLREYTAKRIAKTLLIFIGNTAAAEKGLRMLPGQKDYNRIWKDEQQDEEYAFTRQLKKILQGSDIFVAIDIHNNTGLNPHYACVNRLDNAFLSLANIFSDLIVYFTRPDNVLSLCLAQYAPALTLECGKPGDLEGINKVWNLLEICLELDALPQVDVHALHLFETVAIVKVVETVSVGFNDEADICFVADIDHMNFRELPEGTVWAHIRPLSQTPLVVHDNNGNDVTAKYFSFTDQTVRSLCPVMPSMLTMHSEIIRQDCLCYLMQRIDLQAT